MNKMKKEKSGETHEEGNGLSSSLHRNTNAENEIGDDDTLRRCELGLFIYLKVIHTHLRPRMSAVGAPKRAPKKVPADRIETTRDSVEEVIPYVPSGRRWPKVLSHWGITLTPPITPVS